jgi:serine phosphatase RsbU (regulator of sigma subunit)
MEIGICLIDTEKMEICYAGANRPGYFFKNISDLEEINFDRRAIGGDTPFEYEFKEERFSYNVNDVLYLFSDGYADQFGGENRKKFMTGHFKELLIGLQDRNMSAQEQFIKEEHISWKGNNIQIDDITVLGMKLT